MTGIELLLVELIALLTVCVGSAFAFDRFCTPATEPSTA